MATGGDVEPYTDLLDNVEETSSSVGVPAEAIPAPEWKGVIERVKSAIVALRITGVRPFEDSPAGVWHGTGFVVSLDRPEEALILTNRHIVTTGPIRAFATFDEHEELPAWPVYRDPIHDFGILQFDSTKLRFTPPASIPLSPSGLKVGAEVLVIGNDNAEKIQILAATIARVDRNSPEYDDTNYQDENTFYAGAGSNTSGGSSGSPVIDRGGSCIALNAGGATEASSAFFLPLDRAVYVLDWLRHNRAARPLPPRGTLLTKWLFHPFDMLRRLGFTEEQELQILGRSANAKGSSPATASGRPKGLLVVESSLPGTEAEQVLRPGDVLLEVAGEPCLDFVSLEAKLDGHVGSPLAVRLSRAGKPVEVSLESVDLHKLIPHDFVECAGGVFHQLPYHTCRRFHIPVKERGMFVVQSGFGFGLELPSQSVIVAIAGRSVYELADFEAALAGVDDGEAIEVSWYNPTTNERRRKSSLVRMYRTLWPFCVWRIAHDWPNTWRRVTLAAAPAPATEAAAPGAAGEEAAEADAKGPAPPCDEETALGFPATRDETIARLQPMLCTVTARIAHEYATDFIQSDDERKSTLIRRFGVGLVLDAERGIVLTNRYAVPQLLAHVELTFAQLVTTDATVLFVHPQHNLVFLQYDTAALRELAVCAVDLPTSPAGGDEAQSHGDEQAQEADELSVGEVLSYVALHGDHRLSAKKVTVGSVYLKSWAFAEPPAYRERNLEICNLNDTMQGLGGLLVEPGASGRIRAWFTQFPAGTRHYIAGVPVPVLVGLLRPLGFLPRSPLPLHSARVPALDCEFEELSLAKARRYHGMPVESTRELAASCSDGRRQVLMVSRVTTGGACDGQLCEGDVILRVADTPVTRPQEVERLMEKCTHDSGAEVLWKVLRSKSQVERPVQARWRSSDGTSRLLVFNGLVVRPTLRAVAERGGPLHPHARPGEGLYYWYIFPGSPADTFGLVAPGWLVQVDDEATGSMDSILDALHAGKFQGREWLRCQTMDAEGRTTVRALQPDALFWPTVELVRRVSEHGEAPRWDYIEHGSEATATSGAPREGADQ